jgi:carbamoyltransferase
VHILGISAWYHDAAACLVADGTVVAAVEEERFSRTKHDASFPLRAVESVLRQGGIGASDVDVVAFYEKPVLRFTRILETFVSVAPRGLAAWVHFAPSWVREKLRFEDHVRRALPGFSGRVLYAEHHESHAASAFYPSPFERAAVLTMDGVGEWTTTSVAAGDGRDLRLIEEIRFPHSLGLLYSAFTQYLGFRVNSDEYKVMGLAPYGEPRHVDRILGELIDLRDDGSFRLRVDRLGYLTGLRMTNRRFHAVFGRGPRAPSEPIDTFHADVARSIQAVTEEAMLRLARRAMQVAGSRNLCLAGGVALNCVGNGRILRESGCEGLWIQPAAGDAGGALGAALAVWHRHLGRERLPGGSEDAMRHALLGPSYSDAEVDAALQDLGARAEVCPPDRLAERVAALLADGKVCGWFQGRAEFGPRALGARSILADPRDPHMQSALNLRVKERESFRPFAPAVLRERASEWFDLACESPHMLLVAPLRPERRLPPAPGDADLRGLDRLRARRSVVPAVTHVDHSARVQTVGTEAAPHFRRLLEAFERRTGCPMLVNTSFNGRDEPMVLTPRDAVRCFRRTGLDVLVLGTRILFRDGLPDREPDPPRVAEPQPAAGALARARLWNLLGLVSPFANLGMRIVSPADQRWFGCGAGILLIGATIWALRAEQVAAAGVFATVHVALVVAGIVHPRLPEVAGRAWIRLGTTVGRVVAVPVLSLVYLLVVTPTALLVRLTGSDPLAREAPRTGSWWLPRRPSPPERFERQS